MKKAWPEKTEGPSAIFSKTDKKIFSLEFTGEGDKIVVRSCEGLTGELKTLRKCDDTIISLIKINEYSKKIKELLSNANREGMVGKNILDSLKQTGQLLYDELLPARTKENLNNTNLTNLVLGIDDRLISIPWELLYDGQEFLCQRFNMGRVVSTRQDFSAKQRDVKPPLKMLLLTDPQGNLPSSYDEGIQLRNLLDEKEDLAEVDLKCSEITADYVKGKLRLYDIVHYAGHSDYNPQDPAESGFLLYDGKLKAKDIKGMIGRTPFPAFIFSNACHSGQTEEWHIDQGYENVFGLANAFLVSGVRHYIGTFWEIQDKPSLQFALDFYKELMNGAMIGEAVRRARLRSVETFGENTVIWASYMLYGDPTCQYVDSAESTEHRIPSTQDQQEVLGGSLRGAEHVIAFPKKIRMGYFAVASIVLLGLALAIFLMSNRQDTTALKTERAVLQTAAIDAEKKAEKIDTLIVELVEKYKSKDFSTPIPSDAWQSYPISFVFLNINASGLSAIEKEIILSKVIENLQITKRVNVVDRQILDKLLTELKLSSSDLADPSTALKLGKILSAQLIATGSIAREKDEWLTSLRVIETETSSIKMALSAFLKTKDRLAVAEDLGNKILQKVKGEYPLQANIISVDNQQVTIDLGEASGVAKGARFEVLSDKLLPLGEIEAVAMRRNETRARILKGAAMITEGLRVREIYMP